MSLTLPQAREAAYEAFVAGYSGSYQVIFDDEPLRPGHAAAFMRVSVRHLGGGQDTLGPAGNRHFRRVGLLFVQVFGPGGRSGQKVLDDECSAVRAIFEGKRIGGIDYGDGRARELPPKGDQSARIVEVDFEYDEVK